MALALVACEKPKAAVSGETAPRKTKEPESVPAAAPAENKPEPEVEDATATNERVRAQPRPPDKQHPKPEIPYAAAVKDRPGFVTSPFNGKVIDVRDIPSGTLVQDPSSPPGTKAHFRVP